MRQRASLRLALAVAVLAAVALGGCGTKQLSGRDVEARIRQVIAQQSQNKLLLTSVKCPNRVRAKAGASFTCRVTGANGRSATVTIEQADAKGHVVILPGNLSPLFSR